MKAIFSPVSQNWARTPYFDYFYNTLKTKYNISHHIDITKLIDAKKKRNLKFYPTFLYIIMRALNQNEEFRMDFDEKGTLGFWNFLVPSYTIFHEDDKTFSDIWTAYHSDFNRFYQEVTFDMILYKQRKGIRPKAGRPSNFCPISALPWLSFESVAQDTYGESSMLFPIIRFGKYYLRGDKVLLPFSIFVHHAVADGYHTSKLINDIQDFAIYTEEWINS